MESRTWLRRLHPRDVAGGRRGPATGAGRLGADRPRRTRLVCCPHSGGWAESFLPWRDHLRGLGDEAGGGGVDLLAVQYPGHGGRSAERPTADVHAIADAVQAELTALPPARLLLFGHSFGAMVAYETARRLESAGRPPAVLAVSGARAPGDPAVRLGDAALPDEQLWRRIAQLGGLHPLVAAEPELRALVLPALRADIAAHERYVSAPPPAPISTSIRCYVGADDPLAPAAAAPGWAARTTGRTVVRARRGGHFHLFDLPGELLADLLAEPAGTGTEEAVWA
ncbi:alpha/beta fold hydrolase [Streptomyces sp. GD-15H]|uniref:thioesterase II family protein n=1 Tax=Streptomyces sp. GD-15H TaxID=3129112 RepID=UPI00324B0673